MSMRERVCVCVRLGERESVFVCVCAKCVYTYVKSSLSSCVIAAQNIM